MQEITNRRVITEVSEFRLGEINVVTVRNAAPVIVQILPNGRRVLFSLKN